MAMCLPNVMEGERIIVNGLDNTNTAMSLFTRFQPDMRIGHRMKSRVTSPVRR